MERAPIANPFSLPELGILAIVGQNYHRTGVPRKPLGEQPALDVVHVVDTAIELRLTTCTTGARAAVGQHGISGWTDLSVRYEFAYQSS